MNIPLEPEIFAINREHARDYLNSREFRSFSFPPL
jgi:hypothetical protein